VDDPPARVIELDRQMATPRSTWPPATARPSGTKKIRIVIFGVEATCTEIDDLVTGLVELLDQLLFPGEPIVIYISKCLAKEVQAGRSLNASSVIGRSLIGSPTVLYETGARLDPHQILAHSR
jgi:hypothetical protein